LEHWRDLCLKLLLDSLAPKSFLETFADAKYGTQKFRHGMRTAGVVFEHNRLFVGKRYEWIHRTHYENDVGSTFGQIM
jgi:hypothetical protein